jgi:hypothetical protein
VLLAGYRSAQAEAPKVVIEPRTGLAFPVRITPAGGKGEHTLTGVGVRRKAFRSVKVYAMGIYVDAPEAAQALRAWKGKTADQLRYDSTFYAALLKDDFAKTLRLKMARDVDGKAVWKAFQEELIPRIWTAGRVWGLEGGDRALAESRALFRMDKVREGTELVFTWYPGGRLASRVGRKENQAITNPALCWALFDIYLGESPIEYGAKMSFADRFPAILATYREPPTDAHSE